MLSMILFLLAVGFAVLEILTVGVLAIFVAIGFAVSFILSLFTDNLIVIAVSGFVSCIASLVFLRQYFVRVFSKNIVTNTGIDEKLQKIVYIIEPVPGGPNHYGTVKIDGVIWNAVEVDANPINADVKVEIVKISGSHVVVKVI